MLFLHQLLDPHVDVIVRHVGSFAVFTVHVHSRCAAEAVATLGSAMPPFVVRDARPADQPALERVFRRASLSNAGDRAALLANPEFLALDTTLIGRGRTRVATLADDTIVGFASTSRVEDGVLELDDLFV